MSVLPGHSEYTVESPMELGFRASIWRTGGIYLVLK